ncbi:MAG: hypothetical protein WBN51_05905, partial [Gammaproteobacteria bacterium]
VWSLGLYRSCKQWAAGVMIFLDLDTPILRPVFIRIARSLYIGWIHRLDMKIISQIWPVKIVLNYADNAAGQVSGRCSGDVKSVSYPDY